MICDAATEILIRNVGHDTPLIWRDKDSNILIKTTYFKMLEAMFMLNEGFVSSEFSTFGDFLELLEYQSIEIPNSYNNEILSEGWCWECCADWDGPWLDIEVNTVNENGKTILEFYFNHKYCSGCYDCIGCDSPDKY